MIPLFFVVVCGEGIVAFLLMVKIGPLRELVMKGLDQVKMRRGTVLTIAGSIFVILLSCLFSVVGIQNKGGAMAPMDRVIWRTNLLEATLMGFSLFLGFLIDRMHHYMRRLSKLRSSTGALTREVERLETEKVQMREMGERAAEEAKQFQQEISSLIDDLEMVKMEAAEKDVLLEAAEAHVVALQKQAADLLLEYDCQYEDSQIIQNQALGYHGWK